MEKIIEHLENTKRMCKVMIGDMIVHFYTLIREVLDSGVRNVQLMFGINEQLVGLVC